MSMSLELDGDLVRVGPSPAHGLGVFAALDIPKHTCFTAYPMDLLELWEGAATRRGERKLPRTAALFSRKHKDIDRNVRLRKRLKDYGLELGGVTVYGDPTTYSPGAIYVSGHMINDPRGTTNEANCVECPIGRGALIGTLTLQMVRKDEELLLNYGESYWRARGRNTAASTRGSNRAQCSPRFLK